MLLIEIINYWVITEINLDSIRVITIVDYPISHVAGREIIFCTHPLGIPPAVCDTYLIPFLRRLESQVESTALDDVPRLLWEFGETFIIGVLALKSKTIKVIRATPANSIINCVSPDDFLCFIIIGNFADFISFAFEGAWSCGIIPKRIIGDFICFFIPEFDIWILVAIFSKTLICNSDIDAFLCPSSAYRYTYFICNKVFIISDFY